MQVLDLAYAVALVVTLWATAAGSGLAHRPSELAAVAADRPRLARVVLLNVVAVPLLVAVLVRTMSVPEGYAAGLVLVGAASAGPIGLAVVRIGRADVALAIGLVVTLGAGNLLAIPAWSFMLLASNVRPPVADVVATLTLGVLLPLAIGEALRTLRPDAAAGWAGALGRVSAAGFAIAVAIVVVRNFGSIADAAAARVPLVALVTVVAAAGSGWVVGGPGPTSRSTAALITAVRAGTPALAVASATYGTTSDAAVAIVVFAIVSYLVAGAAAIGFGRMSDRAPGGPTSLTGDRRDVEPSTV